LGISRSNYYKYRGKADRDAIDAQLIQEAFEQSKGTYGTRRLEKGLRNKGIIMNHKKVQRIKKKYDIYPQSNKVANWRGKPIQQENVKKDLVKRHFKIDGKNKVWTTDITYLIFKGRRAYLSTIRDLGTRKVVSAVISHRNDNKLVLDTLSQAIKQAVDTRGVILHSDQGFQYTSWAYKNACQKAGIRISMSRKGTPIDNSPQESFHASLKKETIYNSYYSITSLEEYEKIVLEWIQFYNTDRIRN